MGRKKVIISGGVYDLCHKGHINLFKQMRMRCDVLVIFVTDDKIVYQVKGKIPVQNLKKRMENIKITGIVDKVLPMYTYDHIKEYSKIIKKYRKHDVRYFRGDDTSEFLGKDFFEKNGVPITYLNYTKGVSSTKLQEHLKAL